ncbi:MAG: ABC transporter permease [Desulfobacteraceae bacterium]|nr:MAG: ABC transporter permease [Desulfobacteraceae bacterium]
MLQAGHSTSHLPKKQVVLPFYKSVEIAVKSIKARFFRSMITTMSLILAISFFSYTKFNANIAKTVFIADDKAAVQKLLHLGYEPVNYKDGQGTSPKERWILFLSLLVCVVGIVNTQLMAVTERFRDIGTMKCLGALDRFILRLFLIEAGLQGMIGASIGALFGVLIAFFNTFIRFGTSAWNFISFNDSGMVILTAIALGCMLSILGVLYPALLAARMQPVEAMKGKD